MNWFKGEKKATHVFTLKSWCWCKLSLQPHVDLVRTWVCVLFEKDPTCCTHSLHSQLPSIKCISLISIPVILLSLHLEQPCGFHFESDPSGQPLKPGAPEVLVVWERTRQSFTLEKGPWGDPGGFPTGAIWDRGWWPVSWAVITIEGSAKFETTSKDQCGGYWVIGLAG